MPRPRHVRSTLTLLVALASACASSGPQLVAAPTADATTPAAQATPSPTPQRTTAPTPTPDDLAVTPTAPAAPSQSPTPSPPSSPSSPSPAASATPAPTTAAQPSPAGTAGSCAAGLAGSPVQSSTASADIDADGATDQVTVYGTGTQAEPEPWRIRVDTASGGSVDSPLVVDAGSGAVALGGADLGGGAAHELFTVVGSGASTAIVAIHALVGCDLVQVTAAGAPIAFPIGGSVVNLGGLQCLDTDGDGATDQVMAWLATADFDVADGTYAIEGVQYELRGTELVETGSQTLSANVSEADFVYGNLTCGAVTL